uniref:Uncharacterized protein n=1 Tax=Cacopsylla melanoneura TaxID=428564 RepID=A0A8D9ET99_9HEMI
MYAVAIICLFGFATVESSYSSDALMYNGEDSPVWKSSNGIVFLRPPTRRSIDDLGSNHNNNKDAQNMKWLGLGVLSDMRGFFDNLQTNMDSLEEPHDRQKENVNLLDKESLQIPQAYFHRQRPSHKIRNFVDFSDGQNLRRSNMYDPNLLWSGLGKKR